jgi:chemotaxis methyl-accepting protein methylase
MTCLQIKTAQAYLEIVSKEPDEADNLLSEIGIQVSLFFRNPLIFEIIREQTLPTILEAKRRTGLREIRVWSAGCSAGEEAYSVAILLHQLLKDELKEWRIMIFATDIDRKILTEAERGVFSRAKLCDTRLGVVDEYFTSVGMEFKVKPFIRKLVDFSFDDLASTEKGAPSASIFGAFDLVLCRNVMIYFNEASRDLVRKKIIKSLGRGGYLVLGESEWLSNTDKSELAEVDDRSRIFRKK